MKKYRSNHLKSYFRVLALAFLAVFVFLTSASATTVYYSEAEFRGWSPYTVDHILPGYYLEDFDIPLLNDPQDYVDYSGPDPGYAYSWHGIAQTYGGSDVGTDALLTYLNNLTVNQPTDAIKITFTGAPVTAVGGLFSAYYYDTFKVDVALNDNTSKTIALGSGGFLGFTSTIPFTSLTVWAYTNKPPVQYDTVRTSLDHFYVGNGDEVAPVPEPTTMLLLGAGLLGVAGSVRRRKVAS